ncbi:MAG: hypothetical protein GY778_08190 [bacterium]|nr:hypothetical protein [bacterium]
MRGIVCLFGLVVIAIGIVAVVYGLPRRAPAATQPIAFNHALHLEAAGLECVDCHTDAQTSVHAGIPGKSICLECHDPDDEVEEGTDLAKLAPFADREDDIPWVRVAVTKPDVFFSHRRHVAAGELECIRCHPGQSTLTAPPPAVRQVMAMNDCIDCHQERQVSTDCLACHR